MQYVITIDTGTTNTRTFLWDENRRCAAAARAEVGVHDTAIRGSNAALQEAIRGCLESMLQQAGITYADIRKVMACGMITSKLGLLEVPHVPAPAGKKELAARVVSRLIPEVCPLPITFIPGVKNAMEQVDAENFEAMDIMRGEETETVAILDAFPAAMPCLLVLPGSHSKFVRVDAMGRITGCLTTITGELLDCITNGTIIADAVNHQFVREECYDREMVLKGFDTAMRTGIGRAAFSARILNMFTDQDSQKLANYLLGAALASDVQSIRNSTALAIEPEVTVIVSGKNPLRQAITDILQYDGFFHRIEQYIPDPDLPLSAAGTYLIADAMI